MGNIGFYPAVIIFKGTSYMEIMGRNYTSIADDYPNLFVTTFTGNDILSGGICKIEGSMIVLIVNVVLIALFILYKRRKRKHRFQFVEKSKINQNLQGR